MSVQCNWDQDISSCVTSGNHQRSSTGCLLSKAAHTSPLTLTVPGHCAECTVVSSCRTVECYVRGGYHASVRGQLLEKREDCTLYRAVLRPDSSDVSLKLLSNSCTDKSVVHLVECNVVQGETEPTKDSTSRVNIAAVQDLLPEGCRERSEGVFKMMEAGGGMGSLMASLGGSLFLSNDKPIQLPDNPLKLLADVKQGATMDDIQAMLSHKPAPVNAHDTKGCNCNCKSSLQELITKQAALHTQLSELKQAMVTMQRSMEGTMSVILHAVTQSEARSVDMFSNLVGGVHDGRNIAECAAAAVFKDGTDLSDVKLEGLTIECGVKSGQVLNGSCHKVAANNIVECNGETLD